MIQANELRIGNWVYNQDGTTRGKPKGKPHQITADDFVFANLYLPIPLSHEVLERCGFTKQRDNSYAIECLVLYKDSCWWYSIDATYIENDDGTQSREISHLHQLQNLYYSLTGQELIYKND